MAGPRFLLVSGVTLPDQPNRLWRRPPGRAAADTRAEEAAARGVWTAWRLLGRNNRELGRSPRTFGTVPECVAAVVDLKGAAAAATRLLSVDVEDGRWLWRLEVDGKAVAVSARSYHRQRECLYSLEQFLAAVATAEPPAVLIELPSDERDRLPPQQSIRTQDQLPGKGDDGPPPARGMLTVRLEDGLAC